MKIVVEQLPEKVITVKLKTKNMIDVMVLLGHIIGNRHRPISIKKMRFCFQFKQIQKRKYSQNYFKVLSTMLK